MEAFETKIEKLIELAKEQNETILICYKNTQQTIVGFNGKISTGVKMINAAMKQDEKIESIILLGTFISLKEFKKGNG